MMPQTSVLTPIDYSEIKHLEADVRELPKPGQEKIEFVSLPIFDHPEIDKAPVRHLVTLIHRQTREEKAILVETCTDSFVDVWREICHQRFVLGLKGYEIYETTPLDTPIPF
jgi:hypothetical protein